MTVCLSILRATVCLSILPATVCLSILPATVCLSILSATVCLSILPATVCLSISSSEPTASYSNSPNLRVFFSSHLYYMRDPCFPARCCQFNDILLSCSDAPIHLPPPLFFFLQFTFLVSSDLYFTVARGCHLNSLKSRHQWEQIADGRTDGRSTYCFKRGLKLYRFCGF